MASQEGESGVVCASGSAAVEGDASGPKLLLGVPVELCMKEELSKEERMELCLSVGEECLMPEELDVAMDALLEGRKPQLVCYDGFEPSGRMHLAQGIMKAIYVNRLTKAGCHFIFWVADWFAMLNDKLGGDLKKIRKAGELMVETWRACGMDLSKVEFLWSSEHINARAHEYWPLVMDIARKFNITRVKRCSQIMGRGESDEMPTAQLLYPCMQCADIFFLKADICQLGMDQRKVNMLAREYCDKTKRRFKPIILSHRMMPGLLEGQEKASKSDPRSAIFMDDDTGTVRKKVNGAWCPEGVVEGNPVLEYVRYLVFGALGQVTIERKEEHGGNRTYTNYEELEMDFVDRALHPQDLKNALFRAIEDLLTPVREHFSSGPAKQLLATVRGYKVTK